MTDTSSDSFSGVSNLASFPKRGEKILGRLLVDAGKLKLQDLAAVETYQRENGILFGEAAVKLGLVSQPDIDRMIARQFSYPYLQPSEGELSSELVALYDPFSPQGETFRHLRTQLKLNFFANERKVLAIQGIRQGDGCSYVAANLAAAFSQLGERTILVDANLRDPRQHRLFNVSQQHGLADILAERCGYEVITPIPGFIDLSVLTAGTHAPNPQELLSRLAFRLLISELKEAYDIVLLDCPAAARFADSQIISTAAAGALLVVRKHHSKMPDLSVVQRHLRVSQVECAGAVMTEFK